MRRWLHPVVSRYFLHTLFRSGWWEHAGALLLYTLLSIAVSWPLVRYFTTHITGIGLDPLHNLWLLWHTQQALQGEQPLFDAPLLYYPRGISLLVHGLGPVMGVFALPFWFWGPEAAHNGAVLVALCLTGYCMYLLARGLGFDREIALFAGMMLVTAPMCLAGIFGHMTKVFLGGLPLVLLAVHHALNPQRSNWWTIAPALALLLLLLHSGYQFVFGSFALGFFLVMTVITARRLERRAVLRRSILLCASIVIFAGPLLSAIILTTNDPAYNVTAREQVSKFQPDLAQVFLPSYFSRVFGSIALQLSEEHGLQTHIEKTVTLYVTGMLLCLLAAIRGGRRSWQWLLFTFVCILLALGPTMQFLGETLFTVRDVAIPMPFAFLSELPGFGFIRAPGRFMMVGFVGFGIAASYGLAWLAQRWPRQRYAIVLTATALVFMESWPQPFPQEKLPQTPDFYRQIAQIDEEYGVLDLPIKPSKNAWHVGYSAFFQVHQIVHQKGIFSGYLSRTYAQVPILPHMVTHFGEAQTDISLNSKPISIFTNAQVDLARHGYRYVVWHKNPFFGGDTAWAETATSAFIAAAFGQQPPIRDDALSRVYRIAPYTHTMRLQTTIALHKNWYERNENETRWAVSPATLRTTSPYSQPVLLQITPAFLYEPALENNFHRGTRGELTVETTPGSSTTVQVVADQTTTFPLVLPAESQLITLTLRAGNFQPSSLYANSSDNRWLSFAIRSINLQTAEGMPLPADILVDGRPQQRIRTRIIALYGTNWYQREVTHARRWGQSPAEVVIYSPTDQRVQIRFKPALLHVPGSTNGLGTQGTMRITINGEAAQTLTVRVQQPSSADISLRSGWNTVTFALASGNFRPSDTGAGSSDTRLLSFALTTIDILTR